MGTALHTECRGQHRQAAGREGPRGRSRPAHRLPPRHRPLIQVACMPPANRADASGVASDMDSIDEVHVSEPGLAVLDITARDEETAAAVMSRPDELRATSGLQPVRRIAGEPRLRAAPVRRHPTPRLPRPGMTISIRARIYAGPAVVVVDTTLVGPAVLGLGLEAGPWCRAASRLGRTDTGVTTAESGRSPNSSSCGPLACSARSIRSAAS
ncbi:MULTISPECIES: DUF6207 family protein [Streptomyces]|uniref:DUF6207 family protein n=1 Tax=Streptomyces lycopersici TaxID=2974589 RepID=UPI00293F4A4B|nr:DUF6207 family protein [Streptomyces sp. NEAU-383]